MAGVPAMGRWNCRGKCAGDLVITGNDIQKAMPLLHGLLRLASSPGNCLGRTGFSDVKWASSEIGAAIAGEEARGTQPG